LNIVLETNDCIIVDKPAHWLSVPGRDINDGRPILGRELEKELKIKIYPIHRLDAEVSGLIVYAKSADFHREANVLFENKLVTKTYQAFSEKGSFMKGDKVVWKSLLLRGKKRAYEATYGKPSLTEGFVFDETPKALEWRLNPRTGRAHQLRYELFKHKCPILGDRLYGSEKEWHDGIALRALELEWPAEFAEKWKLEVKVQVPPFSAPL
jgi:tRNA pseudouridine32 synthase / 23S rRNA pseudouridine746 synthase